MTKASTIGELRAKVEMSLRLLRGISPDDLTDMKADVAALRDSRQYDLMGKLAEAINRKDPDDQRNRKFYAQCLIETGNCAAAIDMMRASASALPRDSNDWAEACGLLGRAYKQIFCDARDKSTPEARLALKEALKAYRLPWKRGANPWHGVNLIALLHCARRLNVPVPKDLRPAAISRAVVKSLTKVAPDKRDPWHAAMLAEAYLGLGKLREVEREIRKYAAGPQANAFAIAGTLRQFTDIWNLDKDEDQRRRSIVAALRARLLDLEGHPLTVDPRDAKEIQEFNPSKATLEAILGKEGPQTYNSMKVGMERALSVASVWHVRPDYEERIGSSFLVAAGDFGSFGPKKIKPDELIVVTNWHVVNKLGLGEGIRPEEAEVRFEAASPSSSHKISDILWTADSARHDVAFLRLKGEAPKVKPLKMAKQLPLMAAKPRVFIIGYPGGGELALSLQDSNLVRYEGPPDGEEPQIPDVRLVHYRTPTKSGSSGSPVFYSKNWEVVALHHGTSKVIDANEGISIESIKQAIPGKPRVRKASK